tara:strand:- start:204 stop:449 length:246 start_codon:yes stop_codon:yes gene_type:complete
MSEKNNIISIDGKEYPTDNLKDEQRELIDQINFCQHEIKELTILIRKLNMCQKAKEAYKSDLLTSLENDKTIKTMEDSKVG